MLNGRFSPIAALGFALVMAFFLAACEEDDSGPSESTAGVESADALTEVMSNVMGANDSNPNTAHGQADLPSRLAKLARGLPGLGPTGGGAAAGVNQAVTDVGPVIVDFTGSYPCTGGGTVTVSGTATYIAQYDPVEPVFYNETFSLTNTSMTLSECSEEGYTMSGTVTYTANDSFDFQQTAAGSSLFNFGIDVDENASAQVTAKHDGSGTTYDLSLTLDILGSLDGQVNVVTEEVTITAVNFTATYTVNGVSCTGTWTDPNQTEPTVTCQ